MCVGARCNRLGLGGFWAEPPVEDGGEGGVDAALLPFQR